MSSLISSSNPKDRVGITKVPLHLIPLRFLVWTSLALLDGLCKYNYFNWRKESVAASVYVAAAIRHILKWFYRQENDKDSGVHHLGHAAACLAILADAIGKKNLIDDRPPCCEGDAEYMDEAKHEVIRILKLHGKYQEPTPPIKFEPLPLPGPTLNPECPIDWDGILQDAMAEAEKERPTPEFIPEEQDGIPELPDPPAPEDFDWEDKYDDHEDPDPTDPSPGRPLHPSRDPFEDF